VTDSAIAATAFTDTGLGNGRTYFYVVTALDAAGNESGWSNEVSALPHLTIGWANLQWPPTIDHTISAVNRTDNAYGQVWIDGATSQPGQTPTLQAQLGFGPTTSNPAIDAGWTWVDASFNVDAGNNDEFRASMLPDAVGTYAYVYRYTTTGGRDWLYADLSGPFSGIPSDPGVMTVTSSGDTTAPTAPTGLIVVSQSPAGIELAWNAVVGDRRCTATRCAAARPDPATTRSRSWSGRPATPTRMSSRTRRTTTSFGRWTCRSTGRPIRPR
jgi:hypothetical protein